MKNHKKYFEGIVRFNHIGMEASNDRDRNILASSKVIFPAVLPENTKTTVATEYGDYTMKEFVNIVGAEHSAADYLVIPQKVQNRYQYYVSLVELSKGVTGIFASFEKSLQIRVCLAVKK